MSSGTRLMVGFTLAVALVVGAVLSLATGSWWFLILAVAMHLIATVVVLGTIGRRLRQEEKPDPVTEARLAEEPGRGERGHLAT